MRFKQVMRRNPLVLGLAAAAVAVLLFISEGSYFRSAQTLDALGEMAQARNSLQGPGAQLRRCRGRAARVPADRTQRIPAAL